jgi:hypothetical protein
MADRYWVGGTGDWDATSTTNWSASSGGASGASVPTSADNVFFDANSNTGTGAFTVTMTVTGSCFNFTATGLDGAMTLSKGSSLIRLDVYGSFAVASNFAMNTASAGALRFLATSGTQNITTNGVSIDCPVILGGSAGVVYQLQDNLTILQNCTLNTATLDLNNKILTSSSFTTSGSTARTIAFGSTGKIVLTGSGSSVWSANPTTNFSVTGTPIVDFTYAGSVATSMTHVATAESQAISVNVTAGTYTFTISNSYILNLNFTGFAGAWTNSGTARIYGNLTVSSGMTVSTSTTTFSATSGPKTITTNGRTIDCPITFDGVGGSWQLQDALTVGSTRTVTLTNGSLDLNGKTLTTGIFSGSNSNARTIAFGSTGKIVLVAGGSVWNFTTVTNLTVTGSRQVEQVYTGATGTIINQGSGASTAVSFSFTAGTHAIDISSLGILDLSFTGFSGTLNLGTRTLYGSLTLSSAMTIGAGTSVTTFAATSGTQTITTSGKTIDFPLTFNGVGGTWRLQDALTMGATRTLNLTNGTFDANGFNVTLTLFSINAGTKTLTLGSGTWTVLGSGVSAWNANTNVTGLTVSPSTGIISMNSASAKTFAGGGLTWPTLNQGGAGQLTIQQSNTFANITNTTQPATITFTASTTQTVSAFGVSGTSGNLITLNTTVAGTRATLSDASGTNSVSYVSIKDIAATGGATWNALLTNGNVDAGNNTGWDFGAPSSSGIVYSPALRSFTERKQF